MPAPDYTTAQLCASLADGPVAERTRVFGLLTGDTGVALVTRGPGLASAANGLAQAIQLDYDPSTPGDTRPPPPDRCVIAPTTRTT